MRSLTLYVDKWYIIGAVCTDGIPRLIKLPNREDRFWLYFYEDSANDLIVYGKDNQSHFRDKENHYYGDIFSKVVDPHEYFTIYGRQRKLKDIFEVSGIFEHIRKEIDLEKDIETYVSFSSDITDAARKSFLDILEENGFIVKESVARIAHLALEYGFRHGYFKDEGYYLVLNACNENLHYSIFKHESDYFNRVTESVLLGMGTDLRGRALIEAVIESLNSRLHFLSNQAEIEAECLRMRQFADDWAVKLSNAKPNIPISIPNVSFSGHSANTYSVSIIKKKIDDRTCVIVNDIVRVISDFVTQSNIRVDEVKGILFLGNTFTNAQFEQSISERFLVSSNGLIKYKESDLPSIVGVYSVLDCSQFSDATNLFEQNAEAEALRLKNAREDEERKKRAAEEQEKAAKAERDAREAENKYRTYMEAAEDCERNQDYLGMQDNCRDALAVRPDDPDATQKLQDAIRLAAEEAAIAKQYNSIIQRAKQSFDDKQWSEAKAQAENALNLKPSSIEAQRIYEESKNHLNIESRVKEYLTRSDLFLAQKSYDEAISELKKALSLDKDNSDVAERLRDIESRQREFSSKVQELKTLLQQAEKNNKLDDAISICEQLIDVDASNLRRWSEKAQQLKEKIRDAEKLMQKFQQLRSKIDTALFDEKWDSIVNLCEEALQIQESDDIRSKLNRALEKISTNRARQEEEAKQKVFESKVSEIKALIADKKTVAAERELRNLQLEYPGHNDTYKDLRSRIFAADEWESPSMTHTVPKAPRKPIGFDASNDDLLGTGVKSPTKPQSKPSHQPKVEPKRPSPKTGIDFFDKDIPNKKSAGSVPSSKTNTDFNF